MLQENRKRRYLITIIAKGNPILILLYGLCKDRMCFFSQLTNPERNAELSNHSARLASRCHRTRSASYTCCINAVTRRVRWWDRAWLLRLLLPLPLLLLLLLVAISEHDEPVADAGSDSVVGEGVTISISASASKMSLGRAKLERSGGGGCACENR